MSIGLPKTRRTSESGCLPATEISQNLEFLLNYAILAPSSYNSQPWKFKVQAASIDLYADRSRSLPTIDSAQRELTISCGAALFNLRVAAQNFGYASTVTLLPANEHPDLLAQVALTCQTSIDSDNQLLFEAIPKRHTNRLPFAQIPVPDYLLQELATTAADEGAHFQVITPSQRQTVVDLIAEGQRQQLLDPLCRQELATWIQRNRKDGFASVSSYAQSFQDQDLARQASLLAIISTDRDRCIDWLIAGQAVQNVLLKLTVAGAVSSFFNQPIQITSLRHQLQLAVDQTNVPQVLLRIGYGTKMSATPRRRITDVLL